MVSSVVSVIRFVWEGLFSSLEIGARLAGKSTRLCFSCDTYNFLLSSFGYNVPQGKTQIWDRPRLILYLCFWKGYYHLLPTIKTLRPFCPLSVYCLYNRCLVKSLTFWTGGKLHIQIRETQKNNVFMDLKFDFFGVTNAINSLQEFWTPRGHFLCRRLVILQPVQPRAECFCRGETHHHQKLEAHGMICI